MREVTLDTTVLVKAIVPPKRRKRNGIYEEQFRLYTIAKSILKKVESNEFIMSIPSIAIVEIAAVTARLTGKEERGIQASEHVKEQGVIFFDADILDESTKLAAQTKISGFDATFIACAKLSKSTLITDDKKMFDAAIKLGIPAKLLRNIQD